LRADLQDTLGVKAQMQKDLEAAADFNITMEEKVYKSNKISLCLSAGSNPRRSCSIYKLFLP
jgi:hypothetical protein